VWALSDFAAGSLASVLRRPVHSVPCVVDAARFPRRRRKKPTASIRTSSLALHLRREQLDGPEAPRGRGRGVPPGRFARTIACGS
jgi:hypothetical protein